MQEKLKQKKLKTYPLAKIYFLVITYADSASLCNCFWQETYSLQNPTYVIRKQDIEINQLTANNNNAQN